MLRHLHHIAKQLGETKPLMMLHNAKKKACLFAPEVETVKIYNAEAALLGS